MPRQIDEDQFIVFGEKGGDAGEFPMAAFEAMKEDDRRLRGITAVGARRGGDTNVGKLWIGLLGIGLFRGHGSVSGEVAECSYTYKLGRKSCISMRQNDVSQRALSCAAAQALS